MALVTAVRQKRPNIAAIVDDSVVAIRQIRRANREQNDPTEDTTGSVPHTIGLGQQGRIISMLQARPHRQRWEGQQI
jgi:hypothetical protein